MEASHPGCHEMAGVPCRAVQMKPFPSFKKWLENAGSSWEQNQELGLDRNQVAFKCIIVLIPRKIVLRVWESMTLFQMLRISAFEEEFFQGYAK